MFCQVRLWESPGRTSLRFEGAERGPGFPGPLAYTRLVGGLYPIIVLPPFPAAATWLIAWLLSNASVGLTSIEVLLSSNSKSLPDRCEAVEAVEEPDDRRAGGSPGLRPSASRGNYRSFLSAVAGVPVLQRVLLRAVAAGHRWHRPF
jgi:hypothetical protein